MFHVCSFSCTPEFNETFVKNNHFIISKLNRSKPKKIYNYKQIRIAIQLEQNGRKRIFFPAVCEYCIQWDFTSIACYVNIGLQYTDKLEQKFSLLISH